MSHRSKIDNNYCNQGEMILEEKISYQLGWEYPCKGLKRGLTAICEFKRTFPAFVFNSVFGLVTSADRVPLSPEPVIRPLSKL